MRFNVPKKKGRRGALGTRRRKIVRWKIVIVIVFVIALLFVAGWILRIDNLMIADVQISGNTITKTEQIQRLVDDTLSGTYLLVTPKRNSLFFPKDRLEKNILDSFKRIESVKVVRENLVTISVKVVEREPFALWCGETYVDTEVDFGNCYFIDAESYIFAKAPDFTGNIFFQYFGERVDASASSSPLGTKYMDEVDFTSFGLFLGSFESLPFKLVSLTRIDEKDFEVRTDQGTRIIFGKDQSLSIVLDNLKSILESDALVESDQVIEYIDLRFGNRAFYKFVGEENVGETQ